MFHIRFSHVCIITYSLLYWMINPLYLRANEKKQDESEVNFPYSLYQEGDYYRSTSELLKQHFLHQNNFSGQPFRLLAMNSYRLGEYKRLELLNSLSPLPQEDQHFIQGLLSLSALNKNNLRASKKYWEKIKKEDQGFFRLARKLPYADPEQAYTSSGIIPGSGFLYSNEYGKALTSFLLNGIFLWGMYETYQSQQYSITFLLFFFEREWYFGGKNASKEYAESYNKRLLHKFSRNWINEQEQYFESIIR